MNIIRGTRKLFVILAVAVASFVGSCSLAHAEENKLYATALVKSYHSDREMHYNEENPGIGIEYGQEDFRAVAMYFKNSYDKPAVLLGGIYTPFDIAGVKIGGMAGIVNHYPRKNGQFGPMAAGYVEKMFGNFGVNMIVTPPVRAFDTDRPTWMFALQLKYKFD